MIGEPSDPYGNLYPYANGNPVSQVDPNGDLAFLLPIVGWAVVGGGSDLAIQIVTNGGNLSCVDWGEVGLSAGIGAGFEGAGLIANIFKRAFAALEALRAAKAIPLLPKGLTLGRNAQPGVDVYLGIKNGVPVYCGISCNLARRGAQHGSRFDALQRVTTTSVTRGEARAIEQALTERNPQFQNILNSISPRHSWYDDAIAWGKFWLDSN